LFLSTIQCNPLQFQMDGQVAKPLLYPAASENENLKFQGNEWKCIKPNKWLTHSFTRGPPLSSKVFITSLPLINCLTSHTLSRPAIQLFDVLVKKSNLRHSKLLEWCQHTNKHTSCQTYAFVSHDKQTIMSFFSYYPNFS